MDEKDYKPFIAELTGVMSFYRLDITKFTANMWWGICKRFSLEQIRKAFQVHVQDPEQGVFAPKPANIVKILEGTRTDNSRTAWGRVLESMSRVGAYTDVVFDDHVIHAVIKDLGGWPTVCRTNEDELGYLETRFCKSYQAYSNREDVTFPPFLAGDRSPDEMWAKRGLKPPMPAMIGDKAKCEQVYRLGSMNNERITFVDQLIPDALRLTNEGAA